MKNTVRKSDVIIVVSLIIIFITIIFMNMRLIDRMMLEQIEQVSQNRIEIIRSDFVNSFMEAEQALMKVAVGAEKLNYAGKSREEMESYIIRQSQYMIEASNGAVIGVFAAGKNWEIIPNMTIPKGYHGADQVWYTGAAEKNGEIFFSDPYHDRITGTMCYTLAVLLDDKETVVGMDFSMDVVKEYIDRMAGEDNSTALIVADDGMIVGYQDMSYVGGAISEVLPAYSRVMDKIIMSTDDDKYFSVAIEGENLTVFHAKMDNGWYLALFMSDNALYGDANTQQALNLVVNILLMIAIIGAIVVGSRNRIRAQDALQNREIFVTRILDNLRDPLANILRLSDMERFNNSNDIKADMADIKASSLQLREMMDNLRSYSTIVQDMNNEAAGGKKRHRKLEHSIPIFRNVILIILILVSGISMYFYVNNRRTNVRESVISELDTYELELSQWIGRQQTIVEMFTDIISSQPEMLQDYESMVEWLRKMSSGFNSISCCFVADPLAEHPIISNTGWEKPQDSDWQIEEREWFSKAVLAYPDCHVSAPYIEGTEGKYCITISQAIKDEAGNFYGVFGIDIYMDKLMNIFNDDVYEDEYVFLVDRDGFIINHPNPEYQMTENRQINVADTPYSSAYLVAGEGTSSIRNIRDFNGTYSMSVCRTEKNSGFSLIMVDNWWLWYKEILLYCAIYVVFLVISIVTIIVLLNRVIRSQADMNRELTVTADRAMAAGKAKSDFLAQMSHEIRTPINAVIGMDEMILRESQDQDILEYAGNIKSASQTLLTLINGILDFSKIESGKLEILRVRYETLDMIDHLVNMISDRTEKKGLMLILDIDPKLPHTLFGDDVRIRQVITNILTNAVKYTPTGSVTLSIHGDRGEGEDEYILKVAVKDTGIGIKEEDMGRLFKSFQRLDEERNRNIEGTGLGMSIVQGLLSMMGSSLKVESKYGEGSTFSFELIQKVIDATEIGEYHRRSSAIAEKKAERRAFRLQDTRILVVDDNDMNLKVARGLLKRYGVVPDLVESGKKCLSILREKDYDLILMDHMMPGMDGIETLNNIREQALVPEYVPIIALTANAILGARDEYLSHGFMDYLSKPIDIVQLEEILIKYVPTDKVKFVEESTVDAAKVSGEATDSGKTGVGDGGTKEAPAAAGEPASGDEGAVGETKGPGASGNAGAVAGEMKESADAGKTGTVDGETDAPAGSGDTGAVTEVSSGEGELDGGSFTDRLARAGFNIEGAHSFTMDDDEFYMELLETYVGSAEEKAESIRKFYEEGNWKDYQILVHGLKSSSRTIGADHLADLALAQEMAAKSSDEAAIHAGVDELLKTYKETTETIEKAIH